MGWAEMAVEGMESRRAARAKAMEEGAAVLEAAVVEEAAERETEQARAERIAGRVEASVRRQRRARRPMSEWERQVAAQALGEGWDDWEGPQPAA